MITKEQVVPLLLPACPPCAEGRKAHRNFYGGEERLYIDLGELADHLLAVDEQARRSAFAAVLDTDDALHRQGEE